MQSLLDVRSQFLAQLHTTQNLQLDFHAWHLGRSNFAFWALDVECARTQVLAAERYLADFLMQDYVRQPHITLGISGFLSKHPHYADDYGVCDFEADLRALSVAQIKPFEIEIAQLNSFSSAPFYHVSDMNNNLGELHSCLHRMQQHDHTGYVPHVTVGLYASEIPVATVMERIDTFAQTSVTRLLVEQLSLMSYEASKIGGELTIIADYDLVQNAVKWRSKSPFD